MSSKPFPAQFEPDLVDRTAGNAAVSPLAIDSDPVLLKLSHLEKLPEAVSELVRDRYDLLVLGGAVTEPGVLEAAREIGRRLPGGTIAVVVRDKDLAQQGAERGAHRYLHAERLARGPRGLVLDAMEEHREPRAGGERASAARESVVAPTLPSAARYCSEPIALTDAGGRIVDANQAAVLLLGIPLAELRGRCVVDHPLAESSDRGTLRLPSGEAIEFALRTVRADDGGFFLYMCADTAHERERHEAFTSQDDFRVPMGLATDEIRDRIGIIHTSVTLLVKEFTNLLPSAARRYVASIHDEVRALQREMDMELPVPLARHGAPDPIESCDLEQIVEEVRCEMFRRDRRHMKVELASECLVEAYRPALKSVIEVVFKRFVRWFGDDAASEIRVAAVAEREHSLVVVEGSGRPLPSRFELGRLSADCARAVAAQTGRCDLAVEGDRIRIAIGFPVRRSAACAG